MIASRRRSYAAVLCVVWVCVLVGAAPHRAAGAGVPPSEPPHFENARLHTATFSGSKDRTADGSDGLVTCPLAAVRLQRSETTEWQTQKNNVQVPFTVGAGCVTSLTNGYWHFEVCPGRWIRQFAVHNDKVVAEHFLGLQQHWDDATQTGESTDTDVVSYDSGERTSVPDRIRLSPELPKGELFQAALDELGSFVPAEDHHVARSSYNCTVSGPTLATVVAPYGAGSFCPEHNVYRSAALHMICNQKANIPFMTVFETFPCRYDVYLTSPFVCSLMGVQALPAETGTPRRLRTNEDGHEVWHELVDEDMMFSL